MARLGLDWQLGDCHGEVADGRREPRDEALSVPVG
jgi:hypothetical protein